MWFQVVVDLIRKTGDRRCPGLAIQMVPRVTCLVLPELSFWLLDFRLITAHLFPVHALVDIDAAASSFVALFQKYIGQTTPFLKVTML